jgi:hypothetical protein
MMPSSCSWRLVAMFITCCSAASALAAELYMLSTATGMPLYARQPSSGSLQRLQLLQVHATATQHQGTHLTSSRLGSTPWHDANNNPHADYCEQLQCLAALLSKASRTPLPSLHDDKPTASTIPCCSGWTCQQPTTHPFRWRPPHIRRCTAATIKSPP